MEREWKKRLFASDRTWVPPLRSFLALLHSGEVFTHVLPKVLMGLDVVIAVALSSSWVAGWYFIYREYERADLVLAFFAHFFLLLVSYAVCRIVYLRATHLAALPTDDYAGLRATAIGLRMVAEVVLVTMLGQLAYAVLQPSLGQWFQTLGAAQYSASLGAVTKLMATAIGCAGSAVGFILFLLFYSAASGIDGYLAIEFNTSHVGQHPATLQREVGGSGYEVSSTPPPTQWG